MQLYMHFLSIALLAMTGVTGDVQHGTRASKTEMAERSGDAHHTKAEMDERSDGAHHSKAETDNWDKKHESHKTTPDWKADTAERSGGAHQSKAEMDEPTCSDVIGWFDSDGETFDCAYYEDNDVCSSWGDLYQNQGHTGNTACCACGGGGSNCVNNAAVPYGADPHPNYEGPGFKIKNDTPWFVEISLWQVGALYWELVAPGQYFFQETGAVWFTVRASIQVDEKSDITVWDAVWPVARIVAALILASLGWNPATQLYVVTVFPSVATSIVSSPGVRVLLTELKADFAGEGLEDAMTLSKPGIYAGPAIPRQKPLVMRIHGGMRQENLLDDEGHCREVLQIDALKLEIPCLGDGLFCLAGTTCNDCCNGSEYWNSKVFTACGAEPCWSDGSTCGPGTTCSNCCNPAYNALGFQCGGSCWPDGTICGAGTTCNHCCNGSEYWDSKVFTACGAEPCWGDGTVCGTGTTCHDCCGGNGGADCPWHWFGVCKC